MGEGATGVSKSCDECGVGLQQGWSFTYAGRVLCGSCAFRIFNDDAQKRGRIAGLKEAYLDAINVVVLQGPNAGEDGEKLRNNLIARFKSRISSISQD